MDPIQCVKYGLGGSIGVWVLQGYRGVRGDDGADTWCRNVSKAIPLGVRSTITNLVTGN